jgi:Predicted dinucleotide-binding enzymes
MSNKPGRMKVGSIGDGLEGVILVKALAGAGHTAEAISVTADESIERADSLLPKVEMVSMQEVVERCDLIIMAMDSAATEEAVTGLAQLGYFCPGKDCSSLRARSGVCNPGKRC